MKCKHVATALIALSLAVGALVATTSAYYLPMVTLEKTHDQYAVWTISPITGYLPTGSIVDEETVRLTYYDKRDGQPYAIYPGADNVWVTADSIVLRLAMKDAAPALFLADAYNIEGSLVGDGSFYASGPGWGWANIH